MWKKITIITIGVILLFWLFESIMDTLFFYSEKSFLENFITDVSLHELYIRIITGIFMSSFSAVVLYLFNRAKKKDSDFKLLIDTMNSGAAFLNKDGSFRYVNDKLCKMLGVSNIDEMRKYNIIDFFVGENLNTALMHKDLQIKQNEYKSYEVVCRRKDGEDIPVMISPSPIMEGGSKNGVLLIITDLSRFKKLENKLITEHEQLISIFDSIDEPIFITDTDTYRLLYVNDAFKTKFGGNSGNLCYKIVHGLDSPCEFCKNKMIMESYRDKEDRTFKINTESLNKNRWYRSIVKIIKWPDGRDVRYEMAIEITDTKRMEMVLKESEEKYRLLISKMLNAFAYHKIITNDKGEAVDYEFVEVNKSFEEMTYLNADKIIGRRITDVQPAIKDSNFDWIKEYGEVALEGKEKRFEQYSEPLGKWFSIFAYSPKKDYFATVFEDITRRKKTEKHLKKLYIELQYRMKERTELLNAVNNELSSFAYSVSHDLRSPLRAMDGFSKALIEDYGDKLDEKAIDYLDRIRTGSQRMGGLIDDLLNLSRITRTELNITKVNLSEIVEEVFNKMVKNIDDREIKLNAEKDLIDEADKSMMYLLFKNLLSNSIKFTKGKEYAIIEFGRKLLNNSYAYYIKDNGAGFDIKYLDKIFDVFQKLDNDSDYSGNGIGLATAKRIINRHKGTIWADSVKGKETIIYFTINEK